MAEVNERVDYKGAVTVRLDEDQAAAALDALAARGVESVAVCLLWSVANDVHEKAVAEILRRRHPGVYVTLSSAAVPFVGEYERTATTVFNAYIGPRISSYLVNLEQVLRSKGLAKPPMIMQSYGGVLDIESTCRNAVGTIESGPASGVVGTRFLGEMIGEDNILATDMGGTTFKVGVCGRVASSGTTPLWCCATGMTRQPVLVGLDLKCEMAANNVARSRMEEMFAQYGPELITAVSSEMIRYSGAVLRKRLREIPDGTWSDSGTIAANETRRVCVELRKRGDQLVFDFTGSDPQARQGINLPYHATFGGCFEAVLTALGYDLPKNYGAFGPIEVIAPEGTVVNVQYPGPVSMNTTSGLKTVSYVAASTLAQMLAGSESWKDEVTALTLGFRVVRHAGVNQYGRFYVSTLLELSGSGASPHADGIDSGGYLTCHNVEWLELNFPLMYLFRRHVQDGGGAGKFAGGVGVEATVKLHDAPEEKIKGVAFGVAGLRNSGVGMFGGYPGAPSLLTLLEGTRVNEFLAAHQCIDDLTVLGGRAAAIALLRVRHRQGRRALPAASVVSHKYGYEDARAFWSSAAYVTPGLTRGLPRVVPAPRGRPPVAPTGHRALPTTKMPSHLHKRICETPH